MTAVSAALRYSSVLVLWRAAADAFALHPGSGRACTCFRACSSSSSSAGEQDASQVQGRVTEVGQMPRKNVNLKIPLEIPKEDWPSYPNFKFTVEATEGSARAGRISTPHGDVETPAFIFCATKAAIKGLSMDMMRDCGSQIILSNTYHLMVQPGEDAMRSMGGLAHATRWGGPTLTDSGGYQIFSMGHGSVSDEIKGRRSKSGAADADKGSEGEGWQPSLLSIGEKGARFRSYHDGQVLALSPERSIQVQRAIGADIILVLDECTPFHVEKEYTESSMKRSHRWALRSLSEFIRTDDGTQALYGIVQGGTYPDLREESVDFCNAQPFFGIAVGGSLGSCKDDMYKVVEMTMSRLRKDRPVHLLGIGGVADIFEAVRAGVDTLDCVHPTRLARHGGALVMARHWEKDGLQKGKRPREHIQLGKGQYRNDNRVIDDECQCPTCAGGYTRAYMHHLLRSGELVVFSLIAAHNVFYMNNLFSSIRKAIIKGDNELDREELRWLTPEQVASSRRVQPMSMQSSVG